MDMPAANRELLRAINRFEILDTTRVHKLISRVDLAKTTGLSKASVTGITADLIDEGLLFEKEVSASMGGRRPILLALNPDGAYSLGVYLSFLGISVLIVNFEATILNEYFLPLQAKHYTPDAFVDKIVQAVHACMWEANFSKNQISGLGISIPGLVDSQTGMIRFFPNYGWENVNLRDMVQQRIDHPTYIENSANTLALAEQWFGDVRGVDNFIVITLEHGVGMGIVLDGKLYRGQKGVAGEFGHTTVDPDGPLCRCGQKGCLEAIVGNRAIVLAARAAAAKGEWHPENPETITIDDVLSAAKTGEPCLHNIYAHAGKVLGMGIANLIRIFNPAKILISGKGVEAGEMLFASMYQTISRCLTDTFISDTAIRVQNWDRKDYARGAGTMVLQEIHKSPAHRNVQIM